MGDATLHLVQLRIDARALFRQVGKHRLPPQLVDMGYLVHCLLSDLFGKSMLKPFHITDDSDSADVLAYSGLSADEARLRADRFAEPRVHAACHWDQLASKPMPRDFPAGTRLGFTSRVCPIQRMSSDGDHYRKGAEVDVFLARCWELGDEAEVLRDEVYAKWLEDELERRGGARVVESSLDRFRLARLLRRTQGSDRTARTLKRPDAVMSGTLEVTDTEAFHDTLARGLGRHRAFGFGMLLLRPAGN